MQLKLIISLLIAGFTLACGADLAGAMIVGTVMFTVQVVGSVLGA